MNNYQNALQERLTKVYDSLISMKEYCDKITNYHRKLCKDNLLSKEYIDLSQKLQTTLNSYDTTISTYMNNFNFLEKYNNENMTESYEQLLLELKEINNNCIMVREKYGKNLMNYSNNSCYYNDSYIYKNNTKFETILSIQLFGDDIFEKITMYMENELLV